MTGEVYLVDFQRRVLRGTFAGLPGIAFRLGSGPAVLLSGEIRRRRV